MNYPVGVLLVEDNPGDVELARLSLAESTLEATLQVANGIQVAMDCIDKRTPDVVLLDLGLPDTSGFGGVEAINCRLPTTPIIVLSGRNDQETAIKALESGVQDYLVKGHYTPALLCRAVRYAIERKHSECELLEMARYDSVTGLVNRSYFMSLLDHALERASRFHSDTDILFLDLDHFKNINDTLGHDAGDELLKLVGKRLQDCVRASDVVARLGGDEFIILLEDVDSASSVAHVAENLLGALQPAFMVNAAEIRITPSIGIASYPYAGKDAGTLIRNADIAMYRAKEHGRNTAEFYTDDMSVAVRQSFDLEMALRKALQNHEFELLYQPIVDCVTGRICAGEALLRWRRDPDGELLLPGQFIPALEKTGLIREVGEWVLERACEQCKVWQTSSDSSVRIAVNVSPRQIAMPQFVQQVADILRRTRLAAADLEIEITEELFLEQNSANVKTLQELHGMGVRIAIDDFGTGYSSLGYLATFPFDTIKIDRSFISKISERNNNLVTSGILSIAQGLGRKVIAEGVETDSQHAFLREHDCAMAQGFLFSCPQHVPEFKHLLGQTCLDPSPQVH